MYVEYAQNMVPLESGISASSQKKGKGGDLPKLPATEKKKSVYASQINNLPSPAGKMTTVGSMRNRHNNMSTGQAPMSMSPPPQTAIDKNRRNLTIIPKITSPMKQTTTFPTPTRKGSGMSSYSTEKKTTINFAEMKKMRAAKNQAANLA